VQEKWLSSATKLFKINYDEVLSKLKECAQKFLGKGALTVILIGSLARGDYTAFSDADLVIVAQTTKRPIERALDFLDEVCVKNLKIDLDLFVYTQDELLKMAKERRRIVREILSGKLLAGDESILRMLKQLFAENE
jgi:predicted nucleotidyltransferase